MSAVKIIQCEQGTDEWRACRIGVPTASNFEAIVARTQKGLPTAKRRKYMLQLLGEQLTGTTEDSYSGGHLQRGREMESEARETYAFLSEEKPEPVGFVLNTDLGVGCSPDSMIGERGLLEVKTKLPSLQLEVMLANEVPAEHVAQLQGQIWVCERDWVDFVSFWPGLRPFIKRVERDDNYIADLKRDVQLFMAELAVLKRQLQ